MSINAETRQLLTAQTATGAGAFISDFDNGIKSFQATGTTTAGAGAAVVRAQVSNVPNPTLDGDWVDMGDVTLTLATTKSGDGFAVNATWKHIRGKVVSISGTGASVDCYAVVA